MSPVTLKASTQRCIITIDLIAVLVFFFSTKRLRPSLQSLVGWVVWAKLWASESAGSQEASNLTLAGSHFV